MSLGGDRRERLTVATDTHMPLGSTSAVARDLPSIRSAPERRSSAGRRWRVALVVCGLALLAYLLADIGLATVAQSFRALSWRLLIVLVFPCVLIKLFDTLGWQCTFVATRVPLWTLARIRLAGQAVNTTTPTGTLGGDAVKIWMLRDRVRPSVSLASLIVSKTTMVASQGIFLAIGVLVARHILGIGTPLVRGMEWLLLLEVVAVVGFVVVQLAGVLGRGHRILQRVGIGMGQKVGEAARGADRALATLYRGHPGRVAQSVTWNVLGWFASAAETWLILYLLGSTVSPSGALAIEAFSVGVRFATFFVPAQIGVAEAGSVAACAALGIGADIGLSLSLVRRVREAAWAGIGLLLLAGSPRPAPAMIAASKV
jgi:glycosyltransferase 2 family protein